VQVPSLLLPKEEEEFSGTMLKIVLLQWGLMTVFASLVVARLAALGGAEWLQFLALAGPLLILASPLPSLPSPHLQDHQVQVPSLLLPQGGG
jgi:hypothetical protein